MLGVLIGVMVFGNFDAHACCLLFAVCCLENVVVCCYSRC